MTSIPNVRYFKVKIDHDSLKYFLEQRPYLEKQQKWVTNMLGHDFEIIYKKGKRNIMVDAQEGINCSPCAISIPQSN